MIASAIAPWGLAPGARCPLRRLRTGSCPRRSQSFPPPSSRAKNYLAIAPNGTLTAGLAGSSPTLVQDPVNPLNLFEANTRGNLIQMAYSNDGGNTWTVLVNPTTKPQGQPDFPNLPDPNLNPIPYPNPLVGYAVVGAPSAAIDLQETIYVTYVEQNATGTSGALVLQRLDFSSGTPTFVSQDQILDQWFGADPVINPVIAVDNNQASFTDTTVATPLITFRPTRCRTRRFTSPGAPPTPLRRRCRKTSTRTSSE